MRARSRNCCATRSAATSLRAIAKATARSTFWCAPTRTTAPRSATCATWSSTRRAAAPTRALPPPSPEQRRHRGGPEQRRLGPDRRGCKAPASKPPLNRTPVRGGNSNSRRNSGRSGSGRSPTSISRAGPARSAAFARSAPAVVSANLTGRDLNSVSAEIREGLARLRPELPANVTVGLGGQNEEIETSYRSLMFALSLAIFLVYLVMASQFESLVHPFIILFTVPLALVGVVFSLGHHRDHDQRGGSARCDHPGRHRRQQRHRAGRLRQSVARQGMPKREALVEAGPRAAAADRHDDLDHRAGAVADVVRLGRRRRSARPDGDHGDGRADLFDVADAGADSCGL